MTSTLHSNTAPQQMRYKHYAVRARVDARSVSGTPLNRSILLNCLLQVKCSSDMVVNNPRTPLFASQMISMQKLTP
jgi:hypothetical protein